jgi:uncharacterized protein YdcH (DUF465 family)
MIEPAESGDNASMPSVEAEVLALRRQVELRDELLRILNRRLLQLERGEVGSEGMRRAEIKRLHEENTYLRRLVHSLLDTEMFRWTIPARRLHGKLRARRQGSA